MSYLRIKQPVEKSHWKLGKMWFFFHFRTNCINEAIKDKDFRDTLKLSKIVSVHKKKDSTDKTKYRPGSMLPLLSKFFEKVMQRKWNDYMENFLNQLLYGFHKAYLTQYALFSLTQSCQKELDDSGYVGTILMDLFKAYDCLPHDLMVAKLEAYRLSKECLQLMSDYRRYHKRGQKLVLHIVMGSMSFADSSRIYIVSFTYALCI